MTSRQTNGGARSRPKASTKSKAPDSSNPFASSSPEPEVIEEPHDIGISLREEETEPEKSIPKDLLTRILHEFFTKDATRISRDANAAVGKYVDVFVREAIARAA